MVVGGGWFGTGQLHQPVGQGALAVVYVGDDAKVAQFGDRSVMKESFDDGMHQMEQILNGRLLYFQGHLVLQEFLQLPGNVFSISRPLSQHS